MNKKKLLSLLLLVVIICAASLVLTACNNSDIMTVNATVIVGDAVYSIQNFESSTNASVDVLLIYLTENKDLHIKYTESAYGKYITEIGALAPQYPDWICFYTSVESDKDITEFATTIEYNGTTLYNAGVGVSSAKIMDGGIYAFKVIA